MIGGPIVGVPMPKRFAVQVDNDPADVVTWREFADANRDDPELLADVAKLERGSLLLAGGGAAPEVSITRIDGTDWTPPKLCYLHEVEDGNETPFDPEKHWVCLICAAKLRSMTMVGATSFDVGDVEVTISGVWHDRGRVRRKRS